MLAGGNVTKGMVRIAFGRDLHPSTRLKLQGVSPAGVSLIRGYGRGWWSGSVVFTGGYLGEASEYDASEGGRSLTRSRGTPV